MRREVSECLWTKGARVENFCHGEVDNIKWADQGLIDVIYDMRYPAPSNWEVIRAVQQTMKQPEAYVMLAGNYDLTGPKRVPVSSKGSEVAARVAQGTQMSRGNGIALYIYSLLNDEHIEALRTGPFRNPMKPKWFQTGSASVSSSPFIRCTFSTLAAASRLRRI